MSETILGGAKYDNIYNHAASYKKQLDSNPAWYDKDLAQIRTEDFLRDRIKNPTIADAALQRYVKRHPYKSQKFQLINNLADLEKTPGVDVLIKQNHENYKKLYPKTGSIRETLIKNDRIDLYKVTPKLKGVKKFLLKLKTML